MAEEGAEPESLEIRIRPLAAKDAAFMLELLNQPSFHQFIGDRGVRTVEDALRYLDEGPLASYRENGFGLEAVVLPEDPESPVGVAGLVVRPGLAHPDLGFALLESFFGHGLASKAASWVLERAFREHRLERILAITSKTNGASMRVLEKVGMRFVGTVILPGDDEELNQFAIDRPAGRRDAGAG